MEHALRLYFLGFYVISITVFVAKVIPASFKVTPERRAHGAARFLPPVLVLLNPQRDGSTQIGDIPPLNFPNAVSQ